MTKSQLIETLKPFDDDIQISVLNDGNYKYSPRVFYIMNSDGAGEIVLVTHYEPHGKAAEIRIRG